METDLGTKEATVSRRNGEGAIPVDEAMELESVGAGKVTIPRERTKCLREGVEVVIDVGGPRAAAGSHGIFAGHDGHIHQQRATIPVVQPCA